MQDKDAIIARQASIIARQDAIIARLTQQVETLLKRVEQLEDEIARLKKDSNNSSKPPSSDIVKPQKHGRKTARKKKKRGGQPGHKKHTRKPFAPNDVDQTFEYELTPQDAAGLIALDQWYIVQQVTLPKKLYVVTEHRARKYFDPKTGRTIIASLPDDVKKGGLLGAETTALVAFMKGGCHMSFSTIQTFFEEVFRLDVSRGMLTKATQKVSASLQPSYQQLMERLPNEAYLGIDETGHKDNGDKYWTWCFQRPDYSFFHIDQLRGSQVLFEMLGQEYEGIIGCDFWGAYRKFARLTHATVQYCMAHLIREIRFVAEHTNKRLARWGNQLLAWLRKLFQTLHRSDAWTDAGFAKRMNRIKKDFLRRMRRAPSHKLAKNLARRFKGRAAETYFRFLTDPAVEPTNNGTEREIRHSVIDRRITQGTRGDAGMRWCERIWTTIATCKKQNRNVFEFLHNSLMASWTSKNHPLFL
jgi:transposase